MKREIAYEGMKTPWGKAQSAQEVITGMYFVTTAGHGGMKLSIKLNKLIPDYMRNQGGWYEEDIDWCIPYVILATHDLLTNPKFGEDVDKAVALLRNWKPMMYERFFDVVLKPGESMKKDEMTWQSYNADKLQVLAAWGSGQNVRLSPPAYGDGPLVEYVVKPGFVLVVAAVGGRTNHITEHEEAYYLVPDAEYQAHGPHGFIVDPTHHQKVSHV
jgi:hypothetical protein